MPSRGMGGCHRRACARTCPTGHRALHRGGGRLGQGAPSVRRDASPSPGASTREREAAASRGRTSRGLTASWQLLPPQPIVLWGYAARQAVSTRVAPPHLSHGAATTLYAAPTTRSRPPPTTRASHGLHVNRHSSLMRRWRGAGARARPCPTGGRGGAVHCTGAHALRLPPQCRTRLDITRFFEEADWPSHTRLPGAYGGMALP